MNFRPVGGSLGPTAQLLADTRAALLEEDARVQILHATRKRSASAGPPANARRAARSDHSDRDGQEQQHDGDNHDHYVSFHTGSAASSSNAYGATLEQVETDRMHSNLPYQQLAQASVPRFQKETHISEEQASACFKRHVAAYLLAPEHQCVHGTSSTPVPVEGWRPATYCSWGHCFSVEIPQLRCPTCSQPFEMPSVAARCV